MKFTDSIYSEPGQPKSFSHPTLRFESPAEVQIAAFVMHEVAGAENPITEDLYNWGVDPELGRSPLKIVDEFARQAHLRVSDAADGFKTDPEGEVATVPDDVVAAAQQLRYNSDLTEPVTIVTEGFLGESFIRVAGEYTRNYARAPRGGNRSDWFGRALDWARIQGGRA
jgi:hypothetical protein